VTSRKRYSTVQTVTADPGVNVLTVVNHLCDVFKRWVFLEGGLDLKSVLLEPDIIRIMSTVTIGFTSVT
jgi:hypothetical protein